MDEFIERAFLAERMEEAVEEDLGLVLFVAGDAFGGPGDKVLEALLADFVGNDRPRVVGEWWKGFCYRETAAFDASCVAAFGSRFPTDYLAAGLARRVRDTGDLKLQKRRGLPP